MKNKLTMKEIEEALSHDRIIRLVKKDYFTEEYCQHTRWFSSEIKICPLRNTPFTESPTKEKFIEYLEEQLKVPGNKVSILKRRWEIRRNVNG